MTRYLFFNLFGVFFLLLAGCAYPPANDQNQDVTQETWRPFVQTNPETWTKGADHWFFTGESKKEGPTDRHVPPMAAMSTMMVSASDFTSIQVNGDFQTQIFGTDDHNSVYIYGPNDGVRATAVEMYRHRLSINQIPAAPNDMNRVMVRIGVMHLNQLIQNGSGKIEAIRIQGSPLTISSTGDGNIYMIGRVDIRRIRQSGQGAITIFGATTENLAVTTTACGTVNVSGQVGVRSIVHRSCGNVNVIGANGRGLIIDADGTGKISLYGRINLRNITAKNNVRVYAYTLKSDALSVITTDNAQVSLAGRVNNLSVNASNASLFQGRYLCAEEAMVKMSDGSRSTIAASQRLFASTNRGSRLYFFGPPRVMSSFGTSDSAIIPMGNGGRGC